MRSQIVGRGLTSSAAIADDLGVPHAVVVQALRRFEAVGALRLERSLAPTGPVTVAWNSLSGWFRDLSLPLW